MFQRNTPPFFNRIYQHWLWPFCLAVLLLVGFNLTASAQYEISLDPLGNTTVNLGAPGPDQKIDFYLAEATTSSETLFGITGVFTLEAGVIPGATNVQPLTSMNDSGQIGSTTGLSVPRPFFGEGNIRDSTITKFSETGIVVNQEFLNGSQDLPNDPLRQLWFTLNLDTTGLEGEYDITIADGTDFFRTSGGTVDRVANNNLSFIVTSVPEPGSLALLTIIGGASCLIRRRQRI